jgi:hypothetical protein
MQQHEILLNEKCHDGLTALHYACRLSNIKKIEVLLKEPKLNIFEVDSLGDIPLFTIIRENEDNANTTLLPWKIDAMQPFLDREPCLIMKTYKDGKTLLDIAKSKSDFIATAIARGFQRADQDHLLHEWNKIINMLETYQQQIRWKIFIFIWKTTLKKHRT